MGMRGWALEVENGQWEEQEIRDKGRGEAVHDALITWMYRIISNGEVFTLRKAWLVERPAHRSFFCICVLTMSKGWSNDDADTPDTLPLIQLAPIDTRACPLSSFFIPQSAPFLQYELI